MNNDTIGDHAHHLVVRDGNMASDTVWYGGKWSEPLLNDMAAAAAQTA